MKKLKPILSGFSILVIMGSALAFKDASFFGQGKVSCDSAWRTKIDFVQDNNGLVTKVCGTNPDGSEKPIYGMSGGNCFQLAMGLHYSATAAGK